jgi:hypothetical protein
MARSDNHLKQIVIQNGRKRFLQQISFTTSGAITTLSLTDVYGATVEDGATLVLQANQDFCYELRPSGNTAITARSSNRPGVFVAAGEQEYVNPHDLASITWGKDLKIDVIGDSASGKLNIFVIG